MYGYPHALPPGEIGSMAQIGVEEVYHEAYDHTDHIDEYEEYDMTPDEALEILRQLHQNGHIDLWTFWAWAEAFGL